MIRRLIILLLIVGCGTEPEPIDVDTLDRKQSGGVSVYYIKDTNKPYTGAIFQLYKNNCDQNPCGKKVMEGYLKDGKAHGESTSFGYDKKGFIDGQKKIVKNWKEGRVVKSRMIK